MRTCLYIRCSKDDKGGEREQNPELQLAPLRKEAEKNGDVVVGEFIDMESGGSFVRPRFLEMLQLAKDGGCELIRVWKIDRFSRTDPIESLWVMHELLKLPKPVYIKSLSEPLMDTSDNCPIPKAYRWGLWGFMLGGGYEEREKIRERTKQGIAIKRVMCVCGHHSDLHDSKIRCTAPQCLCVFFVPQWKGGRPKGSVSSKQTERRWDSTPLISASDIFSSKKP